MPLRHRLSNISTIPLKSDLHRHTLTSALLLLVSHCGFTAFSLIEIVKVRLSVISCARSYVPSLSRSHWGLSLNLSRH